MGDPRWSEEPNRYEGTETTIGVADALEELLGHDQEAEVERLEAEWDSVDANPIPETDLGYAGTELAVVLADTAPPRIAMYPSKADTEGNEETIVVNAEALVLDLQEYR